MFSWFKNNILIQTVCLFVGDQFREQSLCRFQTKSTTLPCFVYKFVTKYLIIILNFAIVYKYTTFLLHPCVLMVRDMQCILKFKCKCIISKYLSVWWPK